MQTREPNVAYAEQKVSLSAHTEIFKCSGTAMNILAYLFQFIW
jgi:hypothetical protein